MESAGMRLSQLSHLMEQCSRHLAAAARSAADPQLRATLLHRSGMQHRLACELAFLAGSAMAGDGDKPLEAIENIAAEAAPNETASMYAAARHAGDIAKACGVLLQDCPPTTPGDPSAKLRHALARCYDGAVELQTMLERRLRLMGFRTPEPRTRRRVDADAVRRDR